MIISYKCYENNIEIYYQLDDIKEPDKGTIGLFNGQKGSTASTDNPR